MEKQAFSGMYLHIPFCIAKCHYCSFASVPVRSQKDRRIEHYIDLLLSELDEGVPDWSGERFDSLFLGGGTPSVLPIPHVSRLIKKALECYQFEPDSEITVECNPESFTPQKAYDFQKAGVTRLSFGIQSADDEELRMLGRPHTWADAQNAVDYARMAGFSNINADLIYALPGQKPHGFLQSVRKVLDLGVEHLSCYALTLEVGTKLHEDITLGRLPNIDDDAAADMFESLETLAKEYGLFRYEISNYAKAGHESRHNLHYWHQDSYAGFGVAAHGAMHKGKEVLRVANGDDLEAYLKNGPVKRIEKVSGQDAMFEYVMLGTRLVQGLVLSDFYNRFGTRFEDVYKAATDKAVSLGLAELTPSRFRFSSRGMLVQNSLLQLFMP